MLPAAAVAQKSGPQCGPGIRTAIWDQVARPRQSRTGHPTGFSSPLSGPDLRVAKPPPDRGAACMPNYRWPRPFRNNEYCIRNGTSNQHRTRMAMPPGRRYHGWLRRTGYSDMVCAPCAGPTRVPHKQQSIILVREWNGPARLAMSGLEKRNVARSGAPGSSRPRGQPATRNLASNSIAPGRAGMHCHQ